MISEANPMDRACGVVARIGHGTAVREIRGSLKLGTVVLLDMDKLSDLERGVFKPERRWVVVKELEGGRVVLAQVTTQDSLANQGLPGLRVRLTSGCWEGFDHENATIHPANIREFSRDQLLGSVGELKPEECLAVLGALDAGLGLGTGRVKSKGPGSEERYSRRGTIWRHRRAGVEMMLVSCHAYSSSTGAPQAMVPVVRLDEVSGTPEGAVRVSDVRGVEYWAYPEKIRMLPPDQMGRGGAWVMPQEDDCLSDEGMQVLDAALYDWFELSRHPELVRPDPSKRGFSLRLMQARAAMAVSGRFRVVGTREERVERASVPMRHAVGSPRRGR